MSEKKEYISESSIKESPKKVLNIKLGNGVVKKENMADDSVGLSNLSQDVHQAIASMQVSGIALTGDFGNSEFIGIHQKALTKMKEGLEEDIEEIQEAIGGGSGEESIISRLDALEDDVESISEDIGEDSGSGTIKSRISALEAEVMDDGDGTLKERVETLETNMGVGSVDTRIAAEASRAEAAEAALASGIEGLTQSNIVVGTLPVSGEENTIYRVPGESSYEDYAWNGSAFVKLAEYDNAIDNEPTYNSDNLVKSGGVAFSNIINTKNYIESGKTVVANTQYANFKHFPISTEDGYFVIYATCTNNCVNKYTIADSTWDVYKSNLNIDTLYVFEASSLSSGISWLTPVLYANNTLADGHIKFTMFTLANLNILNNIIKDIADLRSDVNGDVANINEDISDINDAISEINNDIVVSYENEITPYQTYQTSAIALDGNLSQTSAEGSMIVESYTCQEGDIFHISGNWVGYDRCVYSIYNSTTLSADTRIVQGIHPNRTTPDNPKSIDVSVTIPENGSCVAISIYNGNTLVGDKIGIKKVQFSKVNEKVAELENMLAKFNVNYSNGVLVVSKDYASTTKNLLTIRISKVGPNSLMQLSGIKYDSGSYVGSSSDWIGPYVITADSNGNGGSGFTGGWHGYNGDQTGNATARTIGVNLFVDDKSVSEFGVYKGNNIKLIVTNLIQAGNTKISEGIGREVLKEVVSYEFIEDKLHISVESTALENIHISTYYGMQINGYSHQYDFIGNTYKIAPSNTTTYNNNEVTRKIIGYTSNGISCVEACMSNVGLGSFINVPSGGTYAFCIGYGSSGYSKAYYKLIGASSIALPANERIYWEGYYRFFEKT